MGVTVFKLGTAHIQNLPCYRLISETGMDIFVSITDKPILVYFFSSDVLHLFIFFYVKWNVLKRLTRNIRSPVNVLSLSRKKKK